MGKGPYMTAHRTTTDEPDSPVPAQLTLLVVEDDPALRVFLCDLLEGEGYRTLCAGSGTEALALLTDVTPDLMLLDLRLPDLDGYAVCQRIRASAQRRFPILMVSANRDPIDVLEALRIGIDDYLRKPFEVDELLAQIRAHLPMVLPSLADEATPVVTSPPSLDQRCNQPA